MRQFKPGQLLHIEEGYVLLLGPWPFPEDHEGGFTNSDMLWPNTLVFVVGYAKNPFKDQENMVVLYEEKLWMVQKNHFEEDYSDSRNMRTARVTGNPIPWKVAKSKDHHQLENAPLHDK